MTFSCEGGRQKHPGQREEKIVLFGYLEGRLFRLFKSSHAY